MSMPYCCSACLQTYSSIEVYLAHQCPGPYINKLTADDVHHPTHYTSHPSGIECIEIVKHMNYCLGNAIKYIWRAGLKTPDAIKDLRKAAFYINCEIERLEKKNG